MAVNRNCKCTKCNKEYMAILPNNNDVWLDQLMCDDCFDKWMLFRFKRKN